MAEIHDVLLTSIEVGADRARALDPFWAQGLAAIIEQQGLMAPILLRPIEGEDLRYHLVAGLHRLEAFRLMGRDCIPAHLSGAATDDEARLQEVMENLGRAELIALDRCHHLYELKQVWERINPQATHGGDRKSAAIKGQTLPLDPSAPEIFGFSKVVADKIGLSSRAIRLDVKIWKGLAPQSRARLPGTDLARKQTELKALSEIVTPAKQAKVLDLILGDVLPVENVAQALAYLDNGQAPSFAQKAYVKVSQTLAALDDDAFENVIVANEDRVIASLKRRGRI